MKKKLTFFYLYLLMASTMSTEVLAQAKGNARVYGNNNDNYKNNSIYNPPTNTFPISNVLLLNDSTFQVDVNILMNVQASSYVAILGIVQAGNTAKDCNEEMDKRVQGLIKELADNGIRKEDVFMDFVTQVPTYEFEIEKKLFSKSANEIPTGFELKKNVHIKYTKNTQLDNIMLIAANYEIYDLVKVDYHIANMETVYDTLRTKAIGLAKKKVLSFGELNVQFKPENLKYQTIGEDISSTYPEERYASYTAYSNTGLKKNIKTKYEVEKQITYYYNKVNYNKYDLVIHPVIVEPAIQFSYSLKLRYSLKKK